MHLASKTDNIHSDSDGYLAHCLSTCVSHGSATGHLDFVPAVDGIHAFCFRQHTRGKQAILSLNIRSGERDSFSTSIAQKGASPVLVSVHNRGDDWVSRSPRRLC